MQQYSNLNKLNIRSTLTLLVCVLFIITMFVYTIKNRIYQVTAIDSQKYHDAVNKFIVSTDYND